MLADPRSESIILFDIGGGSTEIVWLDVAGKERDQIRSRIRAWASLPIGVVTLAERHGGHLVTPEIYAAMIAEVAVYVDRFAAEHGGTAGLHLLGTSGTVTTIAGVGVVAGG